MRAVDARAHDLLRPETDEQGEEEGARETVFVHCTPGVRAKWQRARFLASRLEGRPLPAWAVAERVAAEALSAIPLDQAARECLEREEALVAGASPEEAAGANGCVAHAQRGEDPRSPTAENRGSPNAEDPRSPTAGASPAAVPGASANGCVHHGSEGDAAVGSARPVGEVATANGCVAHGSGSAVGVAAAGPASAGEATQGTSDVCGPGASAAGHAAASLPAADPRLASLLEALEQADAFELDARLRRALEAEQQLEARMGPYLLAVARGRRYRAHGCASLGEFARERLGISPRKAEALVRLERAGRIAPPLAEAYRAGRLSWVQAQLLVPLATRPGAAPWQAAWVAHAERVTVRRLEDEVSQALALGRLEPPALDPPDGRWDDGGRERPAEASEGALELGGASSLAEASPGAGEVGGGSSSARDREAPAPAAGPAQTGARPSLFGKTVAFFFTAPPDVARLFRGTLATVQRRIERKQRRTASESEALDAMLEHAFATWGLANAELQREHAAFERDGWRCTFPGCTSYGNLNDHHLEYRSWGGSDELSNRTSLCLWHHLRGEHAKILRCRGRAPGKLRFELGLRPGKPPLARYRSGDVRLLGE